jgi:hypothetical protein
MGNAPCFHLGSTVTKEKLIMKIKFLNIIYCFQFDFDLSYQQIDRCCGNFVLLGGW